MTPSACTSKSRLSAPSSRSSVRERTPRPASPVVPKLSKPRDPEAFGSYRDVGQAGISRTQDGLCIQTRRPTRISILIESSLSDSVEVIEINESQCSIAPLRLSGLAPAEVGGALPDYSHLGYDEVVHPMSFSTDTSPVWRADEVHLS